MQTWVRASHVSNTDIGFKCKSFYSDLKARIVLYTVCVFLLSNETNCNFNRAKRGSNQWESYCKCKL